jgi:flagellar basal-body rod protein FlgF
MDPIAVTAASGLRARIQSLDMLANNLANATTAGYKLDREFYSVFGEADASMGGGTRLPMIDKHWTDFSQGTLDPTGSPVDFALSGRGFFTAEGPSGPLYTRNGSFRVSAQGVLTTAEGYPVRAVGGGTIKLTSNAPIEVNAQGSVSQSGQSIGRIEISDFTDPNELSKVGHSYYRASPAANPATPTGTTVAQGKLESSNVVAAESAVRLVGVMRHSEMLQKAIAISTQMGKKSIEEVARVSP